jgi:predicted Fe-Mo cluster-binding NifX family protein
MYIAVAADGADFESNVSKEFKNCKYLLIINMPDMTIEAIENTDNISGDDLARKIVESKCELVITEELELSEFDILADEGVTRFFGYGNSVRAAINMMSINMLKLIRTYDGSDTCGGDHHKH